MKKSTVLIIALLAVSLLLAACAPAVTNPGQTTSAPEPTTSGPVQTTEPEDAVIAKFRELLSGNGDTRNPYFFAIGQEYANPKELDLRTFYSLDDEVRHIPTEAEKAVMKQYFREDWVNAADWHCPYKE